MVFGDVGDDGLDGVALTGNASVAILGNAITLTPGTVTIDVHENRLLVHCLTSNSAQGLRSGEAERRVARLGLD